MKHVYSVGQVNKYIKNMFAQDFMLHHISIKGEVSNCKYHSSGHIYFTMKDADGTINAIMFAGNRREGLKFQMKEGDRVVVTGSVEVYERDGRYQIYARTIERDGEGNLYLKFEALKRASALAFLIFILLYMPCIATVAAIGAEAGWKWAAASVVYNTTLAWFVAWIVYRIALIF